MFKKTEGSSKIEPHRELPPTLPTTYYLIIFVLPVEKGSSPLSLTIAQGRLAFLVLT
jgi:hypothetical protein